MDNGALTAEGGGKIISSRTPTEGRTTVYTKVKDQLVKSFNLEPDSIEPDVKLEDLELDSLDMVDLVITLNDEETLLKEKIEPVIFREARTVQDLVDILSPYMKAE